ncbi:MAG TPA: hypothetical protein VNO22_12980 [Planctomycetota bacterium]|nr:hypothetical protein [Planctomycetota bacterium]
MSLWAWYRARRWGWKIGIAVAALPLGAALLYGVGRTVQYWGAEGDPALYVPREANVVFRARDLEAQLERMEGTVAWRAIRRRLLRHPAIRGAINETLRQAGLPTLDDLEDRRQGTAEGLRRLLWIAGRDAVGALKMGTPGRAPEGLGVVRLPWTLYLAAPFASWVLPSEEEGGRKLLKVRQGRGAIYVAFAGRLALASTDKAFLVRALARAGTPREAGAPLELTVEFDGSPALESLRREFGWVEGVLGAEGTRALTVSADLREEALVVEGTLAGARPVGGEPAPHARAAWAPAGGSGVLAHRAGLSDLHAGLKGLGGSAKNLRQAFETLDEVGKFASTVLPLLEPGMTVVTGGVGDTRVFPAVALICPSREPRRAVEALDGVIRRIGGKFIEQRPLQEHVVGDVAIHSWAPPGALPADEILQPCYAAVRDAFVLGNNLAFTEAVVRVALGEAGSLTEQAHFRALRRELGRHGFVVEPDGAGGVFLAGPIRESLDGLLGPAAQFLVDARLPGPVLRQEIETELREQGRALPPPEVDQLFYERQRQKYREEEEALRARLGFLDAFKWFAFESRSGPRGMSFRAAAAFR